MRRFLKRRGSNAIELAIIAPVLVGITSGIIDYGWYFFTQQTVSSAAREAARAGSLTAWDDLPAEAAYADLKTSLSAAGIPLDDYDVDISYYGTQPDITMLVEVSVDHEPLFGLLPVPDAIHASTSARMEDQTEVWEPPEPV